MSNNINVILKERCYAEAIDEVDNMTLKQLKSVINIDLKTQEQIDGYTIAKAEQKFDNLPDVGGDEDE